ncbi:endonuclease-reverse transcriptase [Aphelenchoides avenae]|nr:endonuclease-reverse transcriptase [Aphelenchus avenae]
MIEIMAALEKINFDVLGLSETHAKKEHSVRWTEGKLIGAEVFSSASSRGQNDSSIEGVGFIVHKSLCESIVAVDVSSSRVAVLKLRVPGQQAPLKVVQVYAPHSGYSDDEREEFYAELERKLAEPSCRTIVLGDFNARIGAVAAGENYIGRHIAEARNDAGMRMAAFAEVKQLYVMNSYYEKPISKRWTWQPADGRTRSEYREHRSPVAIRSENDHRIVRATVKLDMPRMKKHRALANKGRIPKSINTQSTREKIESVKRWYDADQRINDRYEALKEQLMECVRAAEVRRKNDREPRISPETRSMLQRLQLLKQAGDEPEECRRLSHECRKKLKADYDNYRNKRLVEAAESRSSLKKCKRRMAQTQHTTGALIDEEGRLQTERPEVEEVCRKFYTDLFDIKAHVERTPANETAEENPMPDPVTATEVEDALKRFKNEKAPGPDGITAEMLKAGGELFWEQLAKFFTECMRKKRIPLKWKESRTVIQEG